MLVMGADCGDDSRNSGGGRDKWWVKNKVQDGGQGKYYAKGEDNGKDNGDGNGDRKHYFEYKVDIEGKCDGNGKGNGDGDGDGDDDDANAANDDDDDVDGDGDDA